METTDTQQAPPMHAAPQKEHQWLEKLVGEWTYEGGAQMAPDQAPEKFTGIERYRSIGGLWFIGEAEGDTPGGETAQTIITLGYDAQKQSFVGTFIASMMSFMWVYTGELDAGETMLTLYTEGPDMTKAGETAQYKEVIAFESDDVRTFTSHVQSADGQWQQLMKATYRRMK